MLKLTDGAVHRSGSYFTAGGQFSVSETTTYKAEKAIMDFIKQIKKTEEQ